MTSTRPSWPVVAWHAIRPQTLPLSLSPILAGSAVGWVETGAVRPGVLVAAALSAAAIQIGTNLQNDAADCLNGTDQADRLGPVRVTERGWLSARQVLWAAHIAFALAVLCGLYLVALGGWPILTIGLLSVLAGYAYSSGPYPISRGPLGELFVVLFFGVIGVGGVAYLHSGQVSVHALLIGMIIGLPAAGVLLLNNIRDRRSDTLAGRRTLAILLGQRSAQWLFGGLLVGVAAGLSLVAMLGPPWCGAALGLAGLPMGIGIWRALASADGAEKYNVCLGRTAILQLILTVSACLGLVLAAVFHQTEIVDLATDWVVAWR